MRATLLGLALIFLTMFFDSLSRAQEQRLPCAPSGAMDQELKSQYGESIVAGGITGAGIMYITTNPKTGTFSVLLRRPNGMTCIVAGGEGFAIGDAAKITGDGL